jgi:cob(I)alamin adenosyltransferase
LARIYTRTGDKGETGLLGNLRVSKDSLRVSAYGEVDELNSVLGVVSASSQNTEINTLLEGLQRDLFTMGADLASPAQKSRNAQRITKDMIAELERTIDNLQGKLPPLGAFILPGGGQTGALLHFSRCVARRVERSIVALNREEGVNENMIPYVNRLSDLLFVMARFANHQDGIREMEWHQAK